VAELVGVSGVNGVDPDPVGVPARVKVHSACRGDRRLSASTDWTVQRNGPLVGSKKFALLGVQLSECVSWVVTPPTLLVKITRYFTASLAACQLRVGTATVEPSAGDCRWTRPEEYTNEWIGEKIPWTFFGSSSARTRQYVTAPWEGMHLSAVMFGGTRYPAV
jgi:hypothetical protein